MSDALRKALRFALMNEAADTMAGGGGGDKGGEKNDPPADGDGASTPEEKERAGRIGWVGKDKFRGDPSKWTDAKTFLKNGEESLPILRENNRKLQKQVEDLSRSVGEFKKMSDTAFERAYTKAKRELEAEIKEKAKEGDEAGAAKAAGELAELEGEKVKRETAGEKDPVFDAWVEQNDWYRDPDLREEAEVEAFRLRRNRSNLEGEAFLNAVKEAVKKKHPEKFGGGANPRRDPKNGAGPERPSGGGDGGGGGKKGWEHMPSEAKEAGDRYIKQKLYKDRAAYAEAYWAQQ